MFPGACPLKFGQREKIALTVAFLLTDTDSFHICRNEQAGMAQGRPWGYLWAYRSPNFWASGGFHLMPWVGQCTFPPVARARRFGGKRGSPDLGAAPRGLAGRQRPARVFVDPRGCPGVDSSRWDPIRSR